MGALVPAGRDSALDALEQVYRRHYRRVRWVVRARGVPESALDDVVHDVFLSIYRRWSDRDRDVPLATWVTGVARSVAFSARRAAVRRADRGEQAWAPADSTPRPDEAIERNEAWLALQSFLEALPADQREAFVHAELLGASVPEIAALTGTKLNTVYSRLRIARRRFSERFQTSPDARGEWLGRAGTQEQPSSARRRAAWGLVAAELGRPGVGGAVTATVGASLIKSGVTIVGIAAVVVLSVAAGSRIVGADEAPRTGAEPVPVPRVASIETSMETSTETSIEADAADVPEPAPMPEPKPQPTAQSVPGPAPARPPRDEVTAFALADPLEAEVGMLRRARELLNAGKPAAALDEIDRYRAEFGRGRLAREGWSIEHEAACRTGEEARASTAARHLGRPEGCKKTEAP